MSARENVLAKYDMKTDVQGAESGHVYYDQQLDVTADETMDEGEDTGHQDGLITGNNRSTSILSGNSDELEENKEKEKKRFNLLEFFASAFPRVEPIKTTTFIFLSLMSLLPAACYIIAFTDMGFGFTTYFYLSDLFSEYATPLMGGILLAALILYLLDMNTWKSSKARYFFIFILTGAVATWGLFIAGDKPQSPIVIFSLLLPAWFYCIHLFFYSKKPLRVYISWLSGPLFITSFIPSLLFIAWCYLSEENEWNSVTAITMAEKSGCAPDYGEENELSYCMAAYSDDSNDVCFSHNAQDKKFIYEEGCDEQCLEVYSKCSNPFIIWVGPLLVGMGMFFLSFFASFIHSKSLQQDLKNFVKLWIFILGIFTVTISLHGISNDISNTLLSFTFAAFAGSMLLLGASQSSDDIESEFEKIWESITKQFGAWFDILRGFVIVTTLPIAIFYAGLSVVNQCIRKIGIFPCSKKIDPSDSDRVRGWLTDITRKQYSVVKSWDRVKVITYAVYWGLLYMSMNVIATKFATLFLGWVISAVKELPLVAVIFIMLAVGHAMFLIPVIPGIPVYLTLGIVVPAVANETFGGFPQSISFTVLIGLLLKLFSSAVQQKLIGEKLSSSVSVRRTVNVNSSLMRTIRVLLSDPGLSIAKVSILIGGPDWPTSVAAGLLRVNLLPIMIGTTPIVVLIAPTVFSGTLLYMKSVQKDDGSLAYPWSPTVLSICLTATVVVQFGSTLIAAYFVEQAGKTRIEEINSAPIDEEVRLLEIAEEEQTRRYNEITQWRCVPFWAKCTLLLSLFTVNVSCYISFLFPEKCFAKFELTDNIEDALDGNWLNFILPLGWVVLALTTASTMCLYIFSSWTKVMLKKSNASS